MGTVKVQMPGVGESANSVQGKKSPRQTGVNIVHGTTKAHMWSLWIPCPAMWIRQQALYVIHFCLVLPSSKDLTLTLQSFEPNDWSLVINQRLLGSSPFSAAPKSPTSTKHHLSLPPTNAWLCTSLMNIANTSYRNADLEIYQVLDKFDVVKHPPSARNRHLSTWSYSVFTRPRKNTVYSGRQDHSVMRWLAEGQNENRRGEHWAIQWERKARSRRLRGGVRDE